MTTNTMRTTRRGGLIVSWTAKPVLDLALIVPQPFLEHKIYQLDYSRALREYRMLEHFLPKVSFSDCNLVATALI